MISEFTTTGTFRGVPFNYDVSTRIAGRKSVIHTFPNSDVVQSEDLGGAPRAFSMDMIITGIGEEYFSKRDALHTALDTQGKGELNHPLYGKFTVQLDGAYTTTEEIGSQGEATISAPFIRVDSNDKESRPTKRTIDADSNNTSTAIMNTTKGITMYPPNTIIQTANEFISDIGLDGLGEIPLIDNDFLDGVNSIKANIGDIQDRFAAIAQVITNPLDYSKYSALITEFGLSDLTDIGGIIDGVGQLYEKGQEFTADIELWLRGIESTYNYNDDKDTSSTTTTRQQEEARSNDIAFRNLVQVLGVSYAASAMIQINYVTDEQLNVETASIMAQIDKVSDFLTDDSDLFTLLKTIKNNLRAAIDDESLSVFNVEIITIPHNTSMTTLVHNLYGNLDNYDTIRDLNNFTNLSLITGDIKVVKDV